MTKRRPNGHKKTAKSRRRWFRQFGAGAVAVVALAVVVLAVFGMTRGGGSEDATRQPDITPVAEEKPEGATTRQGGPAISFEATSVDFGDVPLDTNVSYAFPFSNTGDATLQIEDVQVKTLEGC